MLSADVSREEEEEQDGEEEGGEEGGEEEGEGATTLIAAETVPPSFSIPFSFPPPSCEWGEEEGEGGGGEEEGRGENVEEDGEEEEGKMEEEGKKEEEGKESERLITRAPIVPPHAKKKKDRSKRKSQRGGISLSSSSFSL